METHELTAALGERVDELAEQVWDIFQHVAPEAESWDEKQAARFVDQARNRLAAVLAVVEHGAEVGDAIRRDLQTVGSNAVNSHSSLQQLVFTLRISRDVLLHSAIRLLSDESEVWQWKLSTFTQMMLPAVDRMTDAITAGCWSEKLRRTQLSLHRFESLVERIPYGIYEVDIDGLIRFANPALAHLAGRDGENLEGYPLNGVLKPVSGGIEILLSEPEDDIAQTTLTVVGPDGGPLTLDVDMVVRREDERIAGFAGVVRLSAPVGAAGVDLTPLVRHIHELRRSIEILNEAGDFVHQNASLMTIDQITEAGESIARQAERLLLVVDELEADRRAISPT